MEEKNDVASINEEIKNESVDAVNKDSVNQDNTTNIEFQVKTEEKTEIEKISTKTEKEEIKVEPNSPFQPQPQSQSQQPLKPESNPQTNSGGWGTWGSWWNAASSTLSQSVDQYVKPTVSTISGTMRELIVDDEPQPKKPVQLYRRDEPNHKTSINNNNNNNSNNNNKNNHSANNSNNSNSNTNNPEVQQNNEQDTDFLSVVDKGFSFLGDGVDKLGNYLNQGLNKVAETANINTSDIQNKAKDMAVSSFNMAKQVASSTTEKATNLGEKIAHQSVDALESVGKKALGYLTVEENIENKKRLRPVFNYVPQVTQMTKEEQESFEDILNRNYFDECNGTAHLQELEKLSIESTLKFQKVEQKLSKLDSQHREEVVTFMNNVKELFDEENEDKKLDVDEVELNEPATKHKIAIDNLAKGAAAKAQEIVEAFKAEVKELRPGESADSIVSSTDICHLTASYMDKTLLESVKRLSQFSASSVEQLLRIVESYLIDVDVAVSQSDESKKIRKDEILKRVAFIYSVTYLLTQELDTISNSFIDSMKQLCEIGKNNFEELGKLGDVELADSKKCAEDLETKASLHTNHIFLDTSNAISNVEECRKFLFPICKSLITATLSFPDENSNSNTKASLKQEETEKEIEIEQETLTKQQN